MIYVYMSPLLSKRLNKILNAFLGDFELSINSELSDLSYDIYFIEINNIEDMDKIEEINRSNSTLIYIVGKRDFNLISNAVSRNIHMYFVKENLENDLLDKKNQIIKQINQRFKYYLINQNFIRIQLRISQIIYVESMNHEIIIHSTTGEIIERKALFQFIKDINSSDFIQVHKSFIINSAYISQIKNKQVCLKNGEAIPIGKKFEKFIITL